MVKKTGYFVLNAEYGPGSTICVAVEPSTACSNTGYTIEVELYNQYGIVTTESLGCTVGHPGIMFNVINHQFFDYVYFT